MVYTYTYSFFVSRRMKKGSKATVLMLTPTLFSSIQILNRRFTKSLWVKPSRIPSYALVAALSFRPVTADSLPQAPDPTLGLRADESKVVNLGNELENWHIRGTWNSVFKKLQVHDDGKIKEKNRKVPVFGTD